jgi:hypothetical protein
LRDERSRNAIELAERFAEGSAIEEELTQARRDADDVWLEWAYEGGSGPVSDAEMDASEAAYHAAWYAERAISAARSASDIAAHALSYEGKQSVEQESQCRLLREHFGNPIHPASVDPSWLAWNGGTIPKLAQAMYDERTFDRLPILADALEEAGCDSADILNHCRKPGGHVRGCWVVDLISGKK